MTKRPSDPPDRETGSRKGGEGAGRRAEGAEGGGVPEPRGKDRGDRSSDPDPHHALNAPVGDPDPTEWPDPYEVRDDPRAPAEEGSDEEPHPPSGSTTTSEPHPSQDPEAEPWEGPKRDKLDD